MIEALKSLMGDGGVAFAVAVEARRYRALVAALPPAEELLEVRLCGFKARGNRFPEAEGWEVVDYDPGIARIPWANLPKRVWREDGNYIDADGGRIQAGMSRIAIYRDGASRMEVHCPLK